MRVLQVRDYLNGTTFYAQDGRREEDIDLPSSNVLQFVLEEGAVVTARPSGTEPKIKFYASCRSEAGMERQKAEEQVAGQLEAIEKDIRSWIPD